MASELAKQIKGGSPDNSWDARRIAGLAVILAIVAAFGIFVVPLLIVATWNYLKLSLLVGAVGFITYTVLNPKFQRGIRYLSESLASGLLGWAIELDRWNILQLKIDGAAKDREKLLRQSQILKGEYDNLKSEIEEKSEAMRQAAAEMQIAKQSLNKHPENETYAETFEIVANEFSNAKVFIDGTQPILNSLNTLVLFADKAYRKSGIALTTAQNTFNTQKALYRAVEKGSNAMAQAMRAFRGDPALNADAEVALRSLKADISNKIGLIQSSIQITSQIMDRQDLKDAAKIQMTLGLVEKFDDKAFEYAEVVTSSRLVGDGATATMTSGNKHLEFLSSKK